MKHIRVGFRTSLKAVFLGALLLGVTCSASGAAVRDELILTPENVRIVIAKDAPDSVRCIAAVELGYLLGQVLEAQIPVVDEATSGDGKEWTSIYLGGASGLDVKDFARDQFRVKIDETGVRLAGRDGLEPKREWRWDRTFERGTAFSVYDFLEREVGMRFYFPGELGTIVPKTKRLVLKFADRTIKPDFQVRRYGYKDGTTPPELKEKAGLMAQGDDVNTMNKYRIRMETQYIPCSHGQVHSKFYKRFAKTHPEYFIMGQDGQRHPSEANAKKPPFWAKEHLCQSSGIWDVLYEDAKCYLSGGSADERQIPSRHREGKYDWPLGAVDRTYYDLMPHDGLQYCYCAACSNNMDHSRKNYATELVWRKTAEVANRLKAAGVKGYVTQMSYYPYADVPKVALPDNVLVMVAHGGPWTWVQKASFEQGRNLVKGWAEKLGHPVWMWTYPDKLYDRACPDIPQMSPHCWGEYFKAYAPYIMGAFCESESDRWMYNHLNYYVFSRVCWDVKTDVDAVLDEYYSLMYGAGGPYVKKFFESLEEKWTKRVVGKEVFTAVGPKTVLPGDYELWMDIYSAKVLAEYDDWLTAAERTAQLGSLTARRLELVRREFYTPLAKRARTVQDEMSVEKGLAKRASRPDKSVVLKNGGFETLEGWSGFPAGETKVELEDKTFVTGKHSIKMTSGGTNLFSYVRQYCRFKPGQKYRVSYFEKLENVVPYNKVGGVFCEYFDGDWHWFPRHGPPLSGTTDWVYREFDFQTLAKPSGDEQYFHFFFSNATGTVWFDDVRIEELPDDAIVPEETNW